jgi:hypothetical protein
MSQRDTFPYTGIRANAPVSPAHTSGLLGNHPDRKEPEGLVFHGEALARVPFLERTGGWIVFGFTVLFALIIIVMNLAGQKPGVAYPLKDTSDTFQFIGEFIGLIFSLTVTSRLGRASKQLSYALRQMQSRRDHTNNELVAARIEAQNAHRAFLAWIFLSIAIAVYASGQAIWTSFDVRMSSAQVPFPGLYDIGFVSSYPFFLVGALLLTRRNNRATVGRARLLLDAFAVIGAAMALSWFFIFSPSIAELSNQPSFGQAFLTIYFPGGDLLLVALGAFLMFSPLSTREQQPVFVRLCLGLFFLAVTDSLLVWLSLTYSFNTGTLQDLLWPLSMQMIGLAAVAYPQSAAREQERAARLSNRAGDLGLSIAVSRFSALTVTLQTVAPFLLALGTCAVLVAVVPAISTLRSQSLAASLIALALFLIVAVRQALTLNENNRLRMQLAGELVLSRRELQVSRREANEATREAQDKQRLEQGVAALQAVHSRIASGDFNVRASTEPGPLQSVAASFNLVIERLKDLAVRASRYDQLVSETRTLQTALEHLSQGAAAWSSVSPNSRTELRPLFLGVERIQRFQLTQWRSLLAALERTVLPLGRIRAALDLSEHAAIVSDKNSAGSSDYSLAQLEQQLQRLIVQTRGLIERQEGGIPQPPLNVPNQSDGYSPLQDPGRRGPGMETPRPQGRFQNGEVYQNNVSDALRFPARPGSIPPRPGRGQDSSPLA